MLAGVKVAVFVAGSAGLVLVSRGPLRRVGSHGFFRFFAWEAMLALILLNVDHWLRDPFGLRQVISWLCLCVSLFLVSHGVRLLGTVGRPDERRADASLLGLERTTTLVTVGTYRYIRHPLYSSLLFLTWGALLKSPSWAAVGLAAVATGLLTATARAEEAENVRYFGAAYREYMGRTKMFIPFVF